MRVIKEGKLPEKKFVMVCYKCSTEFEYTSKDVEEVYEYDDDADEWFHLKCPLPKCGALLGVGKNYIKSYYRSRNRAAKIRRGRPTAAKKPHTVQKEPEK